ncbi:MAG TPA: imidazole glycerol phosphate synthase subunit HisH [Brevundimonas sp.]|uniref:imidazole glycerol phosphate synthase subunit HisH n=1 Tax=Brevundimonas sp. TaxID=1871086 RepID=UPI002DF36B22|nr:imidazole glycerol phosphate synthase subunit HisH [Brevundimonas sp.]
MITIVDYGLGNVGAFANVYKRLDVPVRRARTADELASAERIILPGVGAFDAAMDLLDASGMRDVLEDLVVGKKTPVIGVCVGMQMLADGSDEGERKGLGWIPGRVRHFSHGAGNAELPMPHMGWNDVKPAAGERLFAGMEDDARFYFLHSFYFEPAETDDAVAYASYGLEFACAVRRDHIHGVQFHPEKSHHFGYALLKNFAEA